MTHYWRHPRATAEALRDGWFHTGDIGHLDAGGDLWIDARKDDLIKSGGERIYPAEIEDLLRASPGIRDVAVIGRPDPTWGEVPVAVVVASGARPVTLADIRGPLEGRIARFKQPKAVVLVDDLPAAPSARFCATASEKPSADPRGQAKGSDPFFNNNLCISTRCAERKGSDPVSGPLAHYNSISWPSSVVSRARAST